MSLGDRLKSNFENRTRFYLPRKTYTLIRVDGKNFSSYTHNFDKPFDEGMNTDMLNATLQLCQEISGTVLGYTQSDEISILVEDFKTEKTEAWFDGNLQKIVSVAASKVGAAFNQSRINRMWNSPDQPFELEAALHMAVFDARAFTLPGFQEVEDYFVWRQKDCVRNSVSMAARAQFSHKQLLNKNSKEMLAMLEDVGKPWYDFDSQNKFGAVVYRTTVVEDITFTRSDGEVVTKPNVERKVWQTEAAPVFTEDRGFLRDVVPVRK